MAKLKDLFVDPVAVKDGRWVDYLCGVKLRVARFGNEAHSAFLREAYAPHRKEARDGKLDPDVSIRIGREGVAHHVLRDWSGLEGDDGQPLPFSPAKALELFAHPKLADLYAFVVETARNEDAYREAALEDARGN